MNNDNFDAMHFIFRWKINQVSWRNLVYNPETTLLLWNFVFEICRSLHYAPCAILLQVKSLFFWQKNLQTQRKIKMIILFILSGLCARFVTLCWVTFVQFCCALRSAPCYFTSRKSRSGNFGNDAWGSFWYQNATEAISSCNGKYLPPERHPNACMVIFKSFSNRTGSIMCQR